jgi:hypothetical protein
LFPPKAGFAFICYRCTSEDREYQWLQGSKGDAAEKVREILRQESLSGDAPHPLEVQPDRFYHVMGHGSSEIPQLAMERRREVHGKFDGSRYRAVPFEFGSAARGPGSGRRLFSDFRYENPALGAFVEFGKLRIPA